MDAYPSRTAEPQKYCVCLIASAGLKQVSQPEAPAKSAMDVFGAAEGTSARCMEATGST